jgi:hypothetical protein
LLAWKYLQPKRRIAKSLSFTNDFNRGSDRDDDRERDWVSSGEEGGKKDSTITIGTGAGDDAAAGDDAECRWIALSEDTLCGFRWLIENN